jgi:hypothetical protein
LLAWSPSEVSKIEIGIVDAQDASATQLPDQARTDIDHAMGPLQGPHLAGAPVAHDRGSFARRLDLGVTDAPGAELSAQHFGRGQHDLARVRQAAQPIAERQLKGELPFGPHLLGRLHAQHDHAADMVGGGAVIDGAEAVGPVDFFALAEARHHHEVIFLPGRPAARHHPLDLRPHDRPSLGPQLAQPRPEHHRVSLRTERTTVGVVIETNQLGTPEDARRVMRGQQDAHGRAQCLRPGVRRAERGRSPIVVTNEIAHLAAATQEVGIRQSLRQVDYGFAAHH